MIEDFSNHPKTIGEIQRQKTPSCDACPDGLVAQGLLSRILWRMNE